MNDVVYSHLAAIRTDRDMVFEWPYSIEMFRRYFRNLQDAADVPRFGLHQLRKTCSTILWAADPSAAQLMLGHSSIDITRRHYVKSLEMLTEATAAFPQPAAFGGST